MRQRKVQTDEIRRLTRCLVEEPSLLAAQASKLFRAADKPARKGALAIEGLMDALVELKQEFGLVVGSRQNNNLARIWMRRFDLSGNGTLNEAEFLEVCRWILWRRLEDLDPPILKRGDIIGNAGESSPDAFYAVQRKLGEGAFGSVHLVESYATGAERVMKAIHIQRLADSGVPIAMLKQEIEVLKLLDHPHVVRLFEHYHDNRAVAIAQRHIYLIMDICRGGDLLEFVTSNVKSKRKLPEKWVASFFTQVVEAIAYCHSKGVMHKDIKLDNVMLRDADPELVDLEQVSPHAMVVDVGLATLFGQQHGRRNRFDDVAGSLSTMAPEVLMRNYSYKCDVWSLGCVLFAVFNPKPLWIERKLYPYPFLPRPTKMDQGGRRGLLRAQRFGPPKLPMEVASNPAQVLVRRMLTFDEKKRPAAAACLKLPWLRVPLELGASGSPSARSLQPSPEVLREQVKALTADRRLHAWQRAAIMQAAVALPAADLTQLEVAFRHMDRGRTGAIGHEDLAQVLTDAGAEPEAAREAAAALIDKYDVDKSGRIEWTEFVAAMLPASDELFSAALRIPFQRLDADRDGKLAREEVKALLQGDVDRSGGEFGTPRTRSRASSGMAAAAQETDQILDDLFPNQDEQISFSDFKSYFDRGLSSDSCDAQQLVRLGHAPPSLLFNLGPD